MSSRTERLRGSAVVAVVLLAIVGAGAATGAAIADGSLSIDPGDAEPGAETAHAIALATAADSPHEGNRLAGIGVRYVDSETNLEELGPSDVTVEVNGDAVAVDDVERNDDMLELYVDDGPTLEGGDDLAVEIDGIENPDAGDHVLEVRLVSVETSDGLLGGVFDGLFDLVDALLGGSADDDGERTVDSTEYRIESPDDGDGGNEDDSGDGNESDSNDEVDDGGGDGGDDGSDTSPDDPDGIGDGDGSDGSGGESGGDTDDGSDESGGDGGRDGAENDGEDGSGTGDGDEGSETGAGETAADDGDETGSEDADSDGDDGAIENRTIDASIGSDDGASSDTGGRTDPAAAASSDGDGGTGGDASGLTLSRLVDVMAGVTVVVWAVMLGLLVYRP